MTDIEALAIELHKHLFVTVTDWRDEAGDWDSLGEQAKSEYRLVARRVRDMVAGPPLTNPGDTVEGLDRFVAACENLHKAADRVRAVAARQDELIALRTQCEVMAKALEPFDGCCEYIADDESDEEWAKFRLLVKDYRLARAALQSYRSGAHP